MIPYERTRQQTIPNSAVKIIGVGGAGANMLDRIALDGMEGAELLACNTDVRTLTSSVAPEKIQFGRNLTKGLGAGGDPELGKNAAAEAELEVRDALRDRKIIFICVGTPSTPTGLAMARPSWQNRPCWSASCQPRW